MHGNAAHPAAGSLNFGGNNHTLCPTIAFIRVDLPAFGAPISATKPALVRPVALLSCRLSVIYFLPFWLNMCLYKCGGSSAFCRFARRANTCCRRKPFQLYPHMKFRLMIAARLGVQFIFRHSHFLLPPIPEAQILDFLPEYLARPYRPAS